MASTVGLNSAPALHWIGTDSDRQLWSCLPWQFVASSSLGDGRTGLSCSSCCRQGQGGRKLIEAEKLLLARATSPNSQVVLYVLIGLIVLLVLMAFGYCLSGSRSLHMPRCVHFRGYRCVRSALRALRRGARMPSTTRDPSMRGEDTGISRRPPAPVVFFWGLASSSVSVCFCAILRPVWNPNPSKHAVRGPLLGLACMSGESLGPLRKDTKDKVSTCST